MDCSTLDTFQIENRRELQPVEMRAATSKDVDNCFAVFSTGVGQSKV